MGFRSLLLLFAVGCGWSAGWAAERIVGWRTDGSGVYETAQPPTEWSREKNVVWRTKMPGFSNSQPALVGSRVFIASEPATALALDAADGRILWQQTQRYEEIKATLSAETQRQLAEELERTAVLAKEHSNLSREIDARRKRIKDDPTLKDALDKEIADLRARQEELKAQREALQVAVRYTEPHTDGTAGYTTPTPLCDGRRVYAVFGNGLVAAFDLEGKRLWLKLIEHSTMSFAHSASPVLADGKLVVHFTHLIALNPDDGQELWRLKTPPSHGTPLVTRIGETDVILTPRGAAVRAADGKLLAENLGATGSNSPIRRGDEVFYLKGSAVAVRLPSAITEPFQAQPLWKATVKGGGYWFSSPVVHEGLIYATGDEGVLSVLDAATGAKVYERRIDLDGTNYPSLSLAGKCVYVSSDKGQTQVLRAGREYQAVARNELEPFRSSLVFQGERVYIRTSQHLYCIGK